MPESTAFPTSVGTTDNSQRPVRDPQGKDLLNRMTEGAHGAVDRLADTAGPAVQKIESTVVQANEALHQQAQRARELGDEWSEGVRETVRQHPLTSVLVALAAGALIARISR